MVPNVPSKIGKYDVLGIVGQGGMGVVYKAVDHRLDREVAIKMLTGGFVGDPDLQNRFFREAQSLASLHHPNIVTVYDLGDHKGNPYLVMQYMEGETLDTALTSKRKLSLLEKLKIVIQVCNGLGYAHRRFVVHRDIKPANIMLEKDGGIKIFDFGIAHVGNQTVNKGGQIVGTPPYMSPEQINGKTVDARSDLFSLGVVLYQLCADHLPFQAESTASTFLKILHDPPPPLKAHLSSYPPELDAIIEHALAKDPTERFGSAEEFALDLGHVLNRLEAGVAVEKARVLVTEQKYEDAIRVLESTLVWNTDPDLRSVLEQTCRAAAEYPAGMRAALESAEKLIPARKFVEVVKLLESQPSAYLRNPAFNRLLEDARSQADRIRRIREATDQSQHLCDDADYPGAHKVLEARRQEYANDPKLDAQDALIERRRTEAEELAAETAISDALASIAAGDFQEGLDKLQAIAEIVATVPEAIAVEYRYLRQVATTGLVDSRKNQIEQSVDRGEFTRGGNLLEQALVQFPGEQKLSDLGKVVEGETQRRAKAKAAWVEKVRDAFDASDYERTRTRLLEAAQEFPRDPELMALEVQLGGALKARGKAEKYVVDASKAFELLRWGKGIDALSRVQQIAPDDAVLKNQSLTCLARASEAALATDIPIAHILLDRAAMLAPSSPLVSDLERKIKEREREREREESIVERLASVRRAQQGGDLEGARLEVNRGIKSFPGDARVLQAKLEIEQQLQRLEEKKAQELERARRRELDRDREHEKERQEELERDRARQRAREEEERLRREPAALRERLRAEEAERLERERKEAEEREQVRAEEAECKRGERLEQEKALALQREEERKREQEQLKESCAYVSKKASAESSRRPILRQLTPAYVIAAVVLLAVVIVAWRARAPHTIAIQITTTPDGAAVRITSKDQPGQKQKCVTPNCDFNLRAGKYSVEAKHEGYENAQKEIEVAPNISSTYAIPLVTPPPNPNPPVPAEMVVVKVRGLTAGSEFFVDDKSMGSVGHLGEMSVKVPAGSHQVKVLAKNQSSSIVVRNFVAGGVVSLTPDDLFHHTQAPEDLDWQSALVSSSIDSFEAFLSKYPNGNHRVEAQDLLEERYWEKDLQTNSVESYRDFLQRYSQGPHSATAREELAFLTVDRNEPASLDAFVNTYGNSRHRDAIDHFRDELAWQGTNPNDEMSLDAYLNAFPGGGHAKDARAILTDVRDESMWQRTDRADEESLNNYLNALPEGKHAKDAKDALGELRHLIVDPRKEIIAVLEGYKRAYGDLNFNEMRRIWPAAPGYIQDAFAELKGATLSYGVVGNLTITGDTAVVTIDQALRAMLRNGSSQDVPRKRLIVRLHKRENTQGANPVWLIDSITAN